MSIGGGGGGGPVGFANSFTGPAGAIDVYGDFAAAYSGQQNINTSAVDHLRFTTGNYLFVGEFQFFGAVGFSDLGSGDISLVQISFNDVAITTAKIDTAAEDMPTEVTGPILIPAYTEVLIQVTSGGATAGFNTSVNVIGKIFRK
jgi:hypothetical protein